MRWLAIGAMGLLATACGPKIEQGAGDAASNAAGIAFSYAYTFRLPAPRIADAQERAAAACDALGPNRCRITGMRYRVDPAGAHAGLSVSLAAPIARAFGRQAVAGVEAAGGALAEAEIGGTDAAPAAAEAADDGNEAAADRAGAVAGQARPGQPAAERAAQAERQADAEGRARAAARLAEETRASVERTPMTFAFEPGSGVGAGARLADAWGTLGASASATAVAVLTVAAVAGPPAALALALFLGWRWRGRRWWRRLAGTGG